MGGDCSNCDRFNFPADRVEQLMTPAQELAATLRTIFSADPHTMWTSRGARVRRAFARRDYRVAKEARQKDVPQTALEPATGKDDE